MIKLELPSHFLGDWVREHYSDRLRIAWRATLPSVRDIEISAAARRRDDPPCSSSGKKRFCRRPIS